MSDDRKTVRPVMLRASLSKAEMDELAHLAIDLGVTNRVVISAAIRDYLRLHGREIEGSVKT